MNILRFSKLFLVVFIMLMLALATPATLFAVTKDKDQKTAEQADAAYAQKKYSRALKGYQQLARKGDAFSQYRLSYMNLQGEGVDVDYPEAFAWAVLAAESKDEQLEKYYNEVKALVPEDQRDKAQELAEDYLSRWGRMALAIEARRKADEQLRSCTGSRLGTRCDEVYALQMPKFWKINPGDEPAGATAASGSVSESPTGSGGATRDAEHYAELREARDQLDRYISNNAGTVELGEFEVIEPAADSSAADEAQQ
jgi:tetratricopeptide (TPR) repeat protein